MIASSLQAQLELGHTSTEGSAKWAIYSRPKFGITLVDICCVTVNMQHHGREQRCRLAVPDQVMTTWS
jgi:hypothetical protein